MFNSSKTTADRGSCLTNLGDSGVALSAAWCFPTSSRFPTARKWKWQLTITWRTAIPSSQSQRRGRAFFSNMRASEMQKSLETWGFIIEHEWIGGLEASARAGNGGWDGNAAPLQTPAACPRGLGLACGCRPSTLFHVRDRVVRCCTQGKSLSSLQVRWSLREDVALQYIPVNPGLVISAYYYYTRSSLSHQWKNCFSKSIYFYS